MRVLNLSGIDGTPRAELIIGGVAGAFKGILFSMPPEALSN